MTFNSLKLIALTTVEILKVIFIAVSPTRPKVLQTSTKFFVQLLLFLPDPLQGLGEWRISMESQKQGYLPGLGPFVKRKRESPKCERREESVAGQCRMR